ncbi:MAG: methyltransferase regulatory domain-containing protein [Nitrospirae bacterium]|nr:methyltransferase regulatory domain-containing protein [Nitrospirota bacterium]
MNPYDKFLYPSYAYPQTHPEHLATLATLFGMKPAPVENCRVLELGCSRGGNIVPMALVLPHSEFAGIDLAKSPIEQGQATIDELGLKNITLRQMDIMEVSSDFGQFDYIIAHGLFSWVPPEVQEKIMAICKDHLSPNGVAYVSYNTHPGYHLQGMVRGMMRFHAAQYDEPKEQISQALSFVKFLSESLPETNYSIFLRDTVKELSERCDESIYHDELAEVNLPLYFYQFMELAEKHGLQYLSDANFHDMQEAFPSDITNILQALSKGRTILKEQYMDFFRCRRFRRTILCHMDVKLERTPQPEQMMNYYIASSAQPVSQKPDIASEAEEEFRNSQGASMKTGHPLAKAVIAELADAWPGSLHFNDLLLKVRNRLSSGPSGNETASEEDVLALCKIILWTFAAGLSELHIGPPKFTLNVSERPVVSPLVRLQLKNDNRVTSLHHMSVQMESPLERRLLMLMDGTRDREDLLNELAALVESGSADLQVNGELVQDRQKAIELLREGLEATLNKIARLALYVS